MTSEEENIHLKAERPIINNFNADPQGILFVPEGFEKEGDFLLQSDNEKDVYRQELRRSTLDALDQFYCAGNLTTEEQDSVDVSKLRKLYEEVANTMKQYPQTSLFVELQTRLGVLVQDADALDIEGQKLNQQEVEVAKEGLKFARDVLLKAARGSGLFDAVDMRIEKVLKNPDFAASIEEMHELKDESFGNDGFVKMETETLDRSSPDLAGVSTFYINSKIYQMELALNVAEQNFFKDRARNTKNPIYKERFADEADTREQIETSLKTIIGDISLDRDGPDLNLVFIAGIKFLEYHNYSDEELVSLIDLEGD